MDGTIETSKPDALAHGFGLENVKRVLAQNDGEYVLLQKDGWVQFTALLTDPVHFTSQDEHFTKNGL